MEEEKYNKVKVGLLEIESSTTDIGELCAFALKLLSNGDVKSHVNPIINSKRAMGCYD